MPTISIVGSLGDSAIFCTRDDLEIRFGTDNVLMWADCNNMPQNLARDEFVADRISWAIQEATEDVRSRMRILPYDLTQVPLSKPVVTATCRKAAMLLYGPRSVVDSSGSDNIMTYQSAEYEKFFKQVSAGQIDLGVKRTDQNSSAPFVRNET